MEQILRNDENKNADLKQTNQERESPNENFHDLEGDQNQDVEDNENSKAENRAEAFR